MTTRRKFLRTGAALAGTAALSTALPLDLLAETPMKKRPFGFQVWTIRKQLFEDFEGTLAKLAAMGYSEVEMCSPLGYDGTGFEMFHRYSGTELRKIIEDQGLVCSSTHVNLGEIRDSLDNRIEWCHQMGISQMLLAAFWLPETAGMDDYRRSCEELNEIARKSKEGGIQLGFHNHHMEFKKIDGELIYDMMLQTLDQEVVKMQFQVAVISEGYRAADYFRKHPGRFISAHLQDWSEKDQKYVPVGQGDIDWKDFFKAARKGGVKNFYVEQDPAFFAESAEFLSSM